MVSLKAAVCISDLMYVHCAINKPERPLFFAVCVRNLFVVFFGALKLPAKQTRSSYWSSAYINKHP